jgi:hypothetical protein
MATQEYAASIQGVSIRVTRLDAAGNLLNGPGDSYTTSAFLRVSFTPEYEEGDEITEKSANGTVCVTYKAPDTLKRITMELAICEPDAELSQLLSGGLLLRKTVDGVVKSVGWAAPGVGDDPAGNGVAIEAWSHAVKDGKRASVLPYFHWVFPYAKLRQSGDRVIENGMLATTFEGYGLGNKNFGSAVDGRWEFPVASERPYSYSRASWAPVGLQGFYTWTDQASYQKFFTKGGIQGATTIAITDISGYGNTAAVTLSNTSVNAGIVNGDKVYVNNCGEPFNTSTVGESVTSLNYVAGVATTNVTASNTTIIVANTAGYVAGQDIFELSGTSTLANTTIASVVNATAFTVTTAPSVSGTLTFGLVGMGATANVALANTTVLVASTTGLVPGMTIARLSGGSVLAANTTISTVVNATAITLSSAPTTAGNLVFSINGGNAFYYSTTANLSSALTATLDKYSRVSLVDSVTEAGSYTAVTTTQIDTQYANTNSESNYNVPGNLDYVADNDIDFIIKSNED